MSNNKRYTISFKNDITIKDNMNNIIEILPYGYVNSVMSKYKDSADFIFNQNMPSANSKILPTQIELVGNPPKDFQREVLSIFNKYCFTGHIESPTGSGKTNIIAYLLKKRNIRSVLLFHKTDLIFQTRARILSLLDIPESFILPFSDKMTNNFPPILLVNWQSLQNDKHLQNLINHGNYVQVLCDESHKTSGNEYYDIINKIPALYKHGFTASLYRNNTKNEERLKEVLGNKICSINIEDLYKENLQIRPHIHSIKTNFTINYDSTIMKNNIEQKIEDEKYRWALAYNVVKKRTVLDNNKNVLTAKDLALNPDYRKILIANILLDHKPLEIEHAVKLGKIKKIVDLDKNRNALILSHILDKTSNSNEQTLITFNSSQALKDTYNALNSLGYTNLYYVDGKTDNRYDLLRKISTNLIKNYILFSTTDFIAEGTDIPLLNKIFICSPVYPPFQDASKLQQLVGREMRIADNKTNAITYIFDDYCEGFVNTKKLKTFETLSNYIHPTFSFETTTPEVIIENKKEDIETIPSFTRENLI